MQALLWALHLPMVKVILFINPMNTARTGVFLCFYQVCALLSTCLYPVYNVAKRLRGHGDSFADSSFAKSQFEWLLGGITGLHVGFFIGCVLEWNWRASNLPGLLPEEQQPLTGGAEKQPGSTSAFSADPKPTITEDATTTSTPFDTVSLFRACEKRASSIRIFGAGILLGVACISASQVIYSWNVCAH